MLGNKHLLVIPKTMQYKLLQWAHNHPTAGHAGQQKTLFRLSTRVHWGSMRKDIFSYVNACQECQQLKYMNMPTATPMQLHEVFEPWHTIGIDLMGPFPTTSRQKRFLLVIVDYFTRWVELFAMRTTTSIDIAQILINEVFSRYGLPKYILSDNGPQFVSNIFDDFCRSCGIKQKLTANYHPQTNMTERVNRTLKPMIAMFAQQSPHSWDKEIQKLAFAIRTSINETTGETPAFLMFGRDPRTPLDLIVGDPVEGIPSTAGEQAQIYEYRVNLINNLRSAFNTVREHSEVEKWNQKQEYDRHTSPRQFIIGDLVWVANTIARLGNNLINNKLQPKYQGPCRITKQLTPSTFIVQRLRDNVDLGAINVDRLKAYLRPLVNAQIESISDSDSQANSESETDTESDMADDTELPLGRTTQSRQQDIIDNVGTQTENMRLQPMPEGIGLDASLLTRDFATTTANPSDITPPENNQDIQHPGPKRKRSTVPNEDSDSIISRSFHTRQTTNDQEGQSPPSKKQRESIEDLHSFMTDSATTQQTTNNQSFQHSSSKRQREEPSEDLDSVSSDWSYPEHVTSDSEMRRSPSKRQRRMPARYQQ